MFKNLFSAAVVAGLSAGAASAATIEVSTQSAGVFGSPNWSERVTFETDPAGDLEAGDRVSAGAFRLTGSDGFGNFIAFCVELEDFLTLPEEYEVPADLFTGATLGALNDLYSVAYDSVVDSETAAAFQVAIWDIVYDDGTSVTDGAAAGFSIVNDLDDSVAETANAYLAAVAGYTGPAEFNLTFFESADGQDLVSGVVPLPAAGFMLLAGLGGFAAMRRKS
jgi:hypothetical protein